MASRHSSPSHQSTIWKYVCVNCSVSHKADVLIFTYRLQVNYADIHKCQPHLGNEVNVCGLKHKPHDIKWKCRSDKKYTLFFVDLYPMGESHPKLLSQGILWWVVDIPGCNVPKGFQIYKYQSPLPLYSSGKDKYAFLAYEQPPYDIDWKEESLVSSTYVFI